MKRILFIDPVSTRPYRLDPNAETPLGGTEATLLRVARGLRERGYEVWIAQKAREASETDRHGINYFPFRFREKLLCPNPDVVVCLRAHKIVPWLRRELSCPIYLWLHCFPGTRRSCIGKMSREHDFHVVAVSRSHARFVENRCGVRPIVIYNPLEPGLSKYRTTAKEPDSFIFFSSPHKGLPQVLAMFQRVREHFPRLKLKVANPGYLESGNEKWEGVINLGVLPHHRVLEEVASSFCVFYPQTTFAETFGLVFAEAHAVGTPILTHDLGSAAEVLDDPEQLVDCSDPDAVIERVARWRSQGAPRPAADPRFELTRVVDRWEQVLLHRPSLKRLEAAS